MAVQLARRLSVSFSLVGRLSSAPVAARALDNQPQPCRCLVTLGEDSKARLLSRPPGITLRAYSTGPSSDQRMLPFEEYKKLKKALKLRARLSGLPMGLVGIAVSSFVNVHFNPRMFDATPEEIQPILGMDPIFFAALCGVGTGVVGYMLGGVLFSQTWRILFRKKAKQMAERDEDFLLRIEKHRFSQFNRYEDDYYGEKIATLSDYRQWIRTQQRRRESSDKLKGGAAKETEESSV